MANPDISFTFPYRWLKEKEYLVKNLKRQVEGGESKISFHERLNKPKSSYQIVLKCHAWQPVRIPKKEIEEAMKQVFPTLQFGGFSSFFVQKNNPNVLPVLEMEVYF